MPSEHAAALVVIPTPRIRIPAVKRKRYESKKIIRTQSRGHDIRLREVCTPSTESRREIRLLTTVTPSRWIAALMTVLLCMTVAGLSGAHVEVDGKGG